MPSHCKYFINGHCAVVARECDMPIEQTILRMKACELCLDTDSPETGEVNRPIANMVVRTLVLTSLAGKPREEHGAILSDLRKQGSKVQKMWTKMGPKFAQRASVEPPGRP